MKILSISLLLLAAQGCVITSDEDPFCGDGIRDAGETCDDGNNASGDGCSSVCTAEGTADALITANWSLKNVATGETTTCPPTYNTAAVYSQPVDANFNPVGQPIIDLFDCDDNTGTTAPLPPDVYQVWVEITTGSGGQVYAKSLSAIVDVVDSDKTFTTSILNDGGYFALSWDLVDSITNAPLECSADPAIDGVAALSTSVANANNAFDDRFDCEAHYGVTGGLLQGTYTVDVDVIDSAGASLGSIDVLTNQVIAGQNEVTDLGTIVIPVD